MYYITLYYIVLDYRIHDYTVLYCIMLYYIILTAAETDLGSVVGRRRSDSRAERRRGREAERQRGRDRETESQFSPSERLAEYGWKPHRIVFITVLNSLVYVWKTGVRFHQIRDFKQYYVNRIPPTSHPDRGQG